MAHYKFLSRCTNTCIGLFLVLTLSACDSTPDEEQINAAIEAMSAAVENKQASEIGDYLHDDFLANGKMNAKQVRQLLMLQGMRHSNISITKVSSKTVIDPVYSDKAETTLSLIITGSSGGLPNDGSVRVVKLEWWKDGSDWKVLKASWKEY